MYVNKCIKCGREFETKNPKRVVCPDCLYPDKNMMIDSPEGSSPSEVQNENESAPQFYSSYSAGSDDRPRPPRQQYNNQGGYNRPRQNNRPGGYNNNRQQGGYNRAQGGQRPYNNNRQGGYNNNRYNNQRPQQGGFNQRRPQGPNRFNNKRPNNRNKAPKQLLVSKEQLEQIELLYKLMLPLPNPDAHEVIGEKIGLEPRKVFFGINLVRQKMMLPKLPYPKRKLAITPDQLNAIKMLYEPLLPLPPIGCHKIIAAQLKMDEWRVHVGIGLVRAQMGMERWNQDRPDVPEEFKNQKAEVKSEDTEAEPKKKRGRPKKSEESSEEITSTRANKSFMLIKFEGIDSINDLLPYKGSLLFVTEEIIRQNLDEDEFLIDELVGLGVFDKETDKSLGFVIGVSNNGATDLLSVKTNTKKICLVPFVKAIVPDVDIRNKKIMINNIEGLLE